MRLASWMKPRKLGGRRIDEDWSSPSRRTRLTRVRTVLEDAPPRLLINDISRKIRRARYQFSSIVRRGAGGPSDNILPRDQIRQLARSKGVALDLIVRCARKLYADLRQCAPRYDHPTDREGAFALVDCQALRQLLIENLRRLPADWSRALL